MIEFIPEDTHIVGVRICYTGPAPISSTSASGSDWIGDLWVMGGRIRQIEMVGTTLLLRPIEKGDIVGIIFERLYTVNTDILLAENVRLKQGLAKAHLVAETSKGYPTLQSEAVREFCQKVIAEIE